jgi:hypothetical protein
MNGDEPVVRPLFYGYSRFSSFPPWYVVLTDTLGLWYFSLVAQQNSVVLTPTVVTSSIYTFFLGYYLFDWQ